MLSDRLRRETAGEHEQIERTMGILVSAELTREIYVRMLGRLHAFLVAWEAEAEPVFAAAGLAPFFRERLKSPSLADDLRAMGDVRSTTACRGEELPSTRCLTDVLAAMYVLEGSTLGGQIIAKQLEQHLGVRDGHGYSYFRGVGPETLGRWRAFVLTLNERVPEADEDRAIATAIATFDRLRRWMETA